MGDRTAARDRTDPRLAAVRELLASAGLAAEAGVAGRDGEIAAIRGAVGLRAPLARLAPEIRSLGFRYVALEPDGAYYENEVS